MKLFILTFALLPIIFSCSNEEPSIKITNAWVRQVPPGVKNTALYLDIDNSGVREEKLIQVFSEISIRAEIHETKIVDGNMGKMVRLDGLKIPKDKKTSLTPGGIHVMLINLRKRLNEGDFVDVGLQFEKSGLKKVKAKVKDSAGVNHR